MLGQGLTHAWFAVTDWQRAQFPSGTIEGAAEHLRKEAAEVVGAVALASIATTPDDRDAHVADALEECADVFFLLARVVDLLNRSPRDLSVAVQRKLVKNKARVWPTAPDASGVYAHVAEAA